MYYLLFVLLTSFTLTASASASANEGDGNKLPTESVVLVKYASIASTVKKVIERLEEEFDILPSYPEKPQMPGSSVDIQIFELGTSKYCQENSGRGDRLFSMTLNDGGWTQLAFPTGRNFCIQLDRDKDQSSYFGPYQASDSCSFDIILALDGLTERRLPKETIDLHHILIPEKTCLPEKIDNMDASYVKLINERGKPKELGDEHRGNAFHPILSKTVVFEKGSSINCIQGSGRGDLIVETATGAGRSNRFYFATEKDSEFCIQVDTTEFGKYQLLAFINAIMQREGWQVIMQKYREFFASRVTRSHYMGPFKSLDTDLTTDILDPTSLRNECAITLFPYFVIDYEPDHLEKLYEISKACDPDDISMDFRNVGTENYELSLYEAIAPQDGDIDCMDPEHPGDKIHYFKLDDDATHLYTSSVISDGDPDNKQFCVRANHGKEHAYFGPYPKRQDCVLEITSLDSMTLPDEACKRE